MHEINIVVSAIVLFVVSNYLPHIWKYIDLTVAVFFSLIGLSKLLWRFLNLKNSKISIYVNLAIGLLFFIIGLTVIADDFLYSTVFIIPGMFFFLLSYIKLLKKKFPKDIDLGFKGLVWVIIIFILIMLMISIFAYFTR